LHLALQLVTNALAKYKANNISIKVFENRWHEFQALKLNNNRVVKKQDAEAAKSPWKPGQKATIESTNIIDKSLQEITNNTYETHENIRDLHATTRELLREIRGLRQVSRSPAVRRLSADTKFLGLVRDFQQA
jgi:hypothetical protein